MSSNSSEESNENEDIRYEQYFNAPMGVPHQGIVLLAEILEEELGRDRAYRLIQEKLVKFTRERILSGIEQNPVKDFKDFKNRFAAFSSPRFRNVLETEIQESTSNRLRVLFTKCMFAEAFRSMGAPELGYIWNCNLDFVLTEAGDPRATLVRPTTLMEGHECCDFTWHWKEDE
jgi:hypothetical protein